MLDLGTQITGWITSALVYYISALLAPLDSMIQTFATAGGMRDLTTAPWASNLIAGAQGIAFALLALRLAWDALQQAVLRAEGGVTDPGGLIKRAAMASCAIVAGPWLAKQMIVVSNLLAQAVASAGFGVGLDQLGVGDLLVSMPSPAFLFLAIIPMVVLLPLILFQSLIRTVEILIAAIVAPFAAISFAGEGAMADAWWREVVILCTAQAVQVLLLYVAVASLVSPAHWGTLAAFAGPFLAVATLWVAWRTPHILRAYASGTGMQSAAGGIGQMAIQRALMRR
jgi:hypothetical protein